MIQQFKTIDDLREVIVEYEGMLTRPTMRWSHPTLYRRRDDSKNAKMTKGIRVRDWLFSSDGEWVLPHDQMGLSFSSNFYNLKSVYKLKKKHNVNKIFDIYWVLEIADVPDGLKFEADRSKKGHYFLTVTKPIHLSALIRKLKIVARKLTIIHDGEKVL